MSSANIILMMIIMMIVVVLVTHANANEQKQQLVAVVGQFLGYRLVNVLLFVCLGMLKLNNC